MIRIWLKKCSEKILGVFFAWQLANRQSGGNIVFKFHVQTRRTDL